MENILDSLAVLALMIVVDDSKIQPEGNVLFANHLPAGEESQMTFGKCYEVASDINSTMVMQVGAIIAYCLPVPNE